MAKQNTNTDRRSLQDCGGFSSAEYHSVGLSGGKDSSALLLLMLEKGMPIDNVIFADTGIPRHDCLRPGTAKGGENLCPCPSNRSHQKHERYRHGCPAHGSAADAGCTANTRIAG